MPRVDAAELRQELTQVLLQIEREREPYIILVNDEPKAVLVPYDDYLKSELLAKLGDLSGFDRSLERLAELNAEYSEDEIKHDVDKAIEEVRASKRR